MTDHEKRAGSLGTALILILPFALLTTRAGADIIIVLVDLLFLATTMRRGAWRWCREPVFAWPLVWWAWNVLTSIPWPDLEPARDLAGLTQALVAGRLIIFAAAVAHRLGTSRRACAFLLGTVAMVALWIAFQCWQQFLFGVNWAGDPRWGDGALTGPFDEPRAGPILIMLLFPVILALRARLQGARLQGARLQRARLQGGNQQDGGKIARAGAIALPLILVVTMVLIGQRMPALLTALGLLVTAILIPRLRGLIAGCLVLAALLLALTPIISPPTFAKLVVRFETQITHFSDSDYGRLYERAASMTLAHPALGLGIEGFRRHCHDAAYDPPLPGAPDPGCNIHPHNHYAEAAVAGGLPGLALFCVVVLVWLRRLGSGLLAAPDPERAGLFIALLLALWPLASTSAFLTLPNAGWMFLLLGWGLAVSRRPAPSA